MKKSSELGREILETELLKFDLRLSDLVKSRQLDAIAKKFNFSDHKKLLEAIGFGKFSFRKVIAQLVARDEMRRMSPGPRAGAGGKTTARAAKRAKATAAGQKPRGIVIKSVKEPLIEFGSCCQPLPGEEIVALMTPESGLLVHRADCPKALALEPEKIIAASWSPRLRGKFTATIEVVSTDEKGLLSEMSGAISQLGINISKALVRTLESHKAVATFEVELKNVSELNRVISRLSRIKNVISVEKFSRGA